MKCLVAAMLGALAISAGSNSLKEPPVWDGKNNDPKESKTHYAVLAQMLTFLSRCANQKPWIGVTGASFLVATVFGFLFRAGSRDLLGPDRTFVQSQSNVRIAPKIASFAARQCGRHWQSACAKIRLKRQTQAHLLGNVGTAFSTFCTESVLQKVIKKTKRNPTNLANFGALGGYPKQWVGECVDNKAIVATAWVCLDVFRGLA